MARRFIGPLVIIALGLLVVSRATTAPPGRMPTIGALELGMLPPSPEWKARSLLVQELRTLGCLEGQNIVLEYRWAQGQRGRLSSLAAELVGLPVDVIVVPASPAIHAAQRATTTIPIVMVSVNDPVEDAIVADLARPGSNITGWVAWCQSSVANCWSSSKTRFPRSHRWLSSPIRRIPRPTAWSTTPNVRPMC